MHAYDPLRLVVDVRGTGVSGYGLAQLMRERDIHPELAGENVIVAVFGMGETETDNAARLVEALEQAVTRLPGEREAGGRELMPPPPWGPLEMTPREAFLGAQEVVPIDGAVGRIAAESLAAYPPGIPNVLPGERLTAETLGVRAGDPRPRREPARSQRPHAAHGARGGRRAARCGIGCAR